jgi:hypothetical protein
MSASFITQYEEPLHMSASFIGLMAWPGLQGALQRLLKTFMSAIDAVNASCCVVCHRCRRCVVGLQTSPVSW